MGLHSFTKLIHVMRTLSFFILLGLLLLTKPILAQNSVLAKGEFLKFAVREHGVYRLNAADLRNAGLNLSTLNPRNLKLYGNPGGVLPQNNSQSRPTDLIQNAIQVVGEEDGRFDESDYILFYAEGPNRYFWNNSENIFAHETNFYSDQNFYFLTVDTSEGLRVKPANTSGTPARDINTFLHYEVIEKDESNVLNVIPFAPGGSGRDWYAEKFWDVQPQHSYDFSAEGIESGSTITLTAAVMALSTRVSNFEYSFNGRKVGEQTIASLPDAPYARRGNTSLVQMRFPAAELVGSNSLKLNVQYKFDASQRTAFGYMDYLVLNTRRALTYNDKQLRFRSTEGRGLGLCNYNISNPKSKTLNVWHISSPNSPEILASSVSATAVTVRVASSSSSAIPEMVAFETTNALVPTFVGKIANQNLRALKATDLVVVTHDLFLSEAQRLAAFRRTNDKLSVEVVTVEQIYNEFSSGRQDVSAIRDFFRMLYTQPNSPLKYALLFGDASFDYKDRLSFNTNFVPTYESRESLHPIFSYASDDYFAILGDNEGEWNERASSGDHDLEIGVGRIPIREAEQAKLLVDKLIYYETSKTLGAWRNRLTFVADDGDLNAHQIDSDNLAKHLNSLYGLYNIHKLYMDAYEQVLTTNGKKAIELKKMMNQSVTEGSLIVNYMGHGAEFGWAVEGITDIGQINRWRNLNNMPLFVAATCEFGRYDDPNTVSGGEYVIMNPLGGGIAGVVTTRPVFSNTNYQLAEAFYDIIFEPVGDQMPRLGDVLRKTKNKSLGLSNRNFALLGDPSVQLAYPKYEAKASQILVNGSPSLNIRALDRVRISGQVLSKGTLMSNFNGVLSGEVFDKPALIRTLGEESPIMTYEEQIHRLFTGDVSVKNGLFSFEFVAPLDIDFRDGKGKISLYAKDTAQNIDAAGYRQDIIVGGSNANAVVDNEPPSIELFLNTKNFKNGDAVEAYSLLLADVSDDNGLNITNSDIAHQMVAFLDGEEPLFVLNPYFKPELDNPQKGRIMFELPKLSNGKHTLTLRVWDVYNNLAEKTIEFVVQDQDIEFSELLVGPNPVVDECYFRITHNRPNEPMEVLIQFINMNGQQVHHIRDFYDAAPSKLEVRFRGKDQDNNFLQRGLYVCKISIRSLQDGATGRATKKIMVQR